QQLEHLLNMMREPNITVRIVPSGAPIYPSGAFNLLSFPEDPDIAYVESVGGFGQIIEPQPRQRPWSTLPSDRWRGSHGRALGKAVPCGVGGHMHALHLSSAHWRKSSHSGQEGTTCVEIANLDIAIGVRDSKDPSGPKLTFSPGEWATFAACVKAG